MFATLLGELPRPPLPPDASSGALLDAVLEVQVERGIEPVSTAGWEAPTDDPVAAWRLAAARVAGVTKAVVAGPVSSGRPSAVVRAEIAALASAGCQWIEIREHVPGLLLGDGASAVDRFRAAHEALGAGLEGPHRSLALLGGDAAALGVDAVLAGGYASLAVDLIDGPENWRLVTGLPGDRGVVAGALATARPSDLGVEVLVWAAQYAASARGRGVDRVGLATAGSLRHLSWEDALRKLDRLAQGATLAAAPVGEVAGTIDPRAVDIRSAALGRFDPEAPRGARRRPPRS